jgi:ketosteroid isomerase-like protein
MFSEDRDRSRPAAPVTAAGVDHVRLSYHYLDNGDLDAYGSLLDENAQLSRPDGPPGHGREQILEHQAELAWSAAEHHIYKIIAAGDAVAVMGRVRAGRARDVEFADFFTLTDKGLLLTCRRYYFAAP